MEERRSYTVLQKIIGALSQPRFYAGMVGSRVGAAIGYLCLITVALSLITSTMVSLQFRDAMDEMLSLLQTNAPEFEISNGKFHMAGDQFFISESEDFAFIIDLEEQMSPTHLGQYKNGIYINEDYMYSITSGEFGQPQPWANFEGLDVDKSDVAGILKVISSLWVLLVFLLVIFAIIGKLISSLVVSVIGLVISAITNVRLQYRDVYILGVYAMTGASLLKLIRTVSSLYIPGFWIVYYGVVATYLFLGMRFYKERMELELPSDDHDPLA